MCDSSQPVIRFQPYYSIIEKDFSKFNADADADADADAETYVNHASNYDVSSATGTSIISIASSSEIH